jgi:hypothetical protein
MEPVWYQHVVVGVVDYGEFWSVETGASGEYVIPKEYNPTPQAGDKLAVHAYGASPGVRFEELLLNDTLLTLGAISMPVVNGFWGSGELTPEQRQHLEDLINEEIQKASLEIEVRVDGSMVLMSFIPTREIELKDAVGAGIERFRAGE